MSFITFERLPADRREQILSTGIREFSRKSYKDVSTDSITKSCGISKGILFHYFSSKKAYYLYCLEQSMKRLTSETEEIPEGGFYDVLFAAMDRKMSLCVRYRDEMHLVNMASRDASGEIAQQKDELILEYAAAVRAESAQTIEKALAALELKKDVEERAVEDALHLYISALLNRYLLRYQQAPDRFFEDSGRIRRDLREYLDLMLYGICG